MPFIPLSNEIAGILTPGPAAPEFLKVVGDGQTAKCTLKVPDKDQDGQPLSSIATISVLYKTTSMVGSNAEAELAAGTPAVSLAVTKEQAGQVVEVDIPGIPYHIEYYYDAFAV